MYEILSARQQDSASRICRSHPWSRQAERTFTRTRIKDTSKAICDPNYETTGLSVRPKQQAEQICTEHGPRTTARVYSSPITRILLKDINEEYLPQTLTKDTDPEYPSRINCKRYPSRISHWDTLQGCRPKEMPRTLPNEWLQRYTQRTTHKDIPNGYPNDILQEYSPKNPSPWYLGTRRSSDRSV